MALTEFNKLYDELAPELSKLEGKRLELKKKGIRLGSIISGILFLVSLIIIACTGLGTVGIVIALIICIIIFFCSINAQSKELSGYFKSDIIQPIIKTIHESVDYEPANGISEEAFRKCGLFSTVPDRYHTEDLIKGQVEKTFFKCAEVHAKERRVTHDSKGHRQETWVDIFRGFLFIADFNKNFNGYTVLKRKSLFKIGKGERVKLEDPVFEKSFDVYSTNQVEARYLLTPNMMEHLLELDRKFPGEITVSFNDSNVILAIPDRTNHFEATVWRSMLDKERLRQEFSTILSLISIVNDLNLNTRIWTKE